MAQRPVTDDEREQVRRLHAEGLGRNAIARRLRRGTRTVSTIADALGLSFDRAAQTAAATEARSADLAARRQHLAEQLHDDAERMRAQLWTPTTVYNFGGKENTYEEHTFDEAPADIKKSIMSSVGVAVDRSLKLSPPKDDTGVDQGIDLITSLMSGLAKIHAAQKQGADGEGA